MINSHSSIPLGKEKEMTTTNSYNKGGSAGSALFHLNTKSIHTCRTSLNSNKARSENILNIGSVFHQGKSHAFLSTFDTLLDSNSTKFYKGGN